MNKAGRFATFNCRAPHSLLRALSLLLLPAAVLAQQDPPADQEPFEEARELSETAVGPIPNETHASRQAPTELIIMAAREPEKLIGKTLILYDGAASKTVGPVTALRRRLQDMELYVIVDATRFFNSPTQYAVAVRELDRIDGDTLVIPEAPGMHLRGLDYYPADYTDIEEPAVVPTGDELE